MGRRSTRRMLRKYCVLNSGIQVLTSRTTRSYIRGTSATLTQVRNHYRHASALQFSTNQSVRWRLHRSVSSATYGDKVLLNVSAICTVHTAHSARRKLSVVCTDPWAYFLFHIGGRTFFLLLSCKYDNITVSRFNMQHFLTC